MGSLTDTYLPWFILREIPGLNNRVLKRLIEQFKTPEAIFNASSENLCKVKGIGPKSLKALSGYKSHTQRAQSLVLKISDAGFKIASLSDPAYPELLKKTYDPPLLLFYDGKLTGNAPCISIVGSRKATRYGLDTAGYLAQRLSSRGFTVVSGMAAGIDTAAHKGALSRCGLTVAVLGSGLCRIYPRQNKHLYRQIKNQGAVLTEFNNDAPPLPGHFPRRNRIIAGMSVGTIVVEAAQKSGSLITARLAGEYNREVFAVPGSIRSNNSRGTHALIRQGAKLIETEEDIIDELGQFVHWESRASKPTVTAKKQFPDMDKPQSLIYNLLEPYPVHIDDISAGTGLESHVTAAVLLDMELSGLILRHPGNYYSKSEE